MRNGYVDDYTQNQVCLDKYDCPDLIAVALNLAGATGVQPL
jgi:hypothetical protein